MMSFNINNYCTLVFDCDGVVLDSNKVKTEAFYQAALPYGDKAAQQLVDYHVARGGVSRYEKFEWFIHTVVSEQQEPDLNELLTAYALKVRQGLLSCAIADGLFELREKTANASWLIVSGGDQTELRDVFTQRGLIQLFDGGVFGSPDPKEVILARELDNKIIKKPALFLGDSQYDHVAAAFANIDFVFVHDWTEFKDWPQYCSLNNINVIKSVRDILVL